ncbi:hypothetical protein LTR62_000667 [Meristemomyces frigidus]|uniref:Enoyl reductase (ER) domain-containing protein n=1 Tax=Meristemomyces frigidus TaxID=1508187 RepID=A0AAN7YC94_9PEZI|nr:hypothetical protein LTR62_000667 [Meristemomyces frigidus]
MSTFDSKAWLYTAGYQSLYFGTTEVPRANDIKGLGTTPHMLVKINACALNPVDVQMMNLPMWRIPTMATPKGCVCDFSGTVIAGGRTGFIQGDEIFGLTMKPMTKGGGALSEMAEFDMANTVAVKKPKQWSHEKAAAISLVWLTAKSCIEQVSQYVDETQTKRVAVLGGSSAVGIYTIILAKQKGWKVITTSSQRNKDFVTTSLKADDHVDYTQQNVRQAIQQFAPDAVIDCVGGTSCIGLPSSKRYISIVGDKTGRSSMGGPYTYYNLLGPLPAYQAASQWLRWARGKYMSGESYDVIMLDMNKQWLEEAKTTLSPEEIYIDSVFAFDEAKKAFEKLNTGRARGKVVVKISETGVKNTA